jgi:hypothetical protein
MKNNDFMLLLKYAAITGNVLFVLWVSFNAVKENFQGTIYEKISGVGLICLLIINCILILNKGKAKQFFNQ